MKRTLVALLPLLLVAACTHSSPPQPASTTEATVTVPEVAPSESPAVLTTPSPTVPSVAETPAVASPSSILTALDALVVDDGFYPGYVRELFGDGWLDTDNNGCDSRNDVLTRDLINTTIAPDCKVLSGTLHDPYTGETINFVRGPESGQVQIDHLVALSDAWRSGAYAWDTAKRETFANDPANLYATKGEVNGSKSDSNAAKWLPPLESFHCQYTKGQVEIKTRYGLTVTSAEKTTLRAILAGCEGSTSAPVVSVPPAAVPPVAQPDNNGTDTRFSSCKEAKAAGFGPYQQGVDPEYDFYRDGDGDGLVCE